MLGMKMGLLKGGGTNNILLYHYFSLGHPYIFTFLHEVNHPQNAMFISSKKFVPIQFVLPLCQVSTDMGSMICFNIHLFSSDAAVLDTALTLSLRHPTPQVEIAVFDFKRAAGDPMT